MWSSPAVFSPTARRAGSSMPTQRDWATGGASRISPLLSATRGLRPPPLPGARSMGAAAPANDTVVLAGGESPGGVSAEVFAYSPTTKRWQRLPDLPTPRRALAVVGLDVFVHVVAGATESGSVSP